MPFSKHRKFTRSGYNSCQSLLCPACRRQAGRQGRRTASDHGFLWPTERAANAPLFYVYEGRDFKLSTLS